MRHSTITIIADIKVDPTGKVNHRVDLEALLRDKVDPLFNASRNIADCDGKFPFDKIRHLHFASFAILHEEHELDRGIPYPDKEKLQPCLLFEATVDGEIDDFLDTLLHVAGHQLDEVYSHVDGYPESGSKLPHLVKTFFKLHDVGYNTFYSGISGKTVAQIIEENWLRRNISKVVERFKSTPGSLGQSLRAIQRQLRRFAVRGGFIPGEPRFPKWFRWAEEVPSTPFNVKYGPEALRLLGALLIVVAAFLLLRLSDYEFGDVADCYRNTTVAQHFCEQKEPVNVTAQVINAVVFSPIRLATKLIGPDWMLTVMMSLVVTFIIWVVARGLFYLLSLWERYGNSGLTRFVWGLVRQIVLSIRWMAAVILTMVGAILLPVLKPADLGIPTFFQEPLISALLALVVTIFLFGFWFQLRLAKSKPEARPGERHDTVYARGLRDLAVDLIRLCMVAAIYGLLLVLIWAAGIQGSPIIYAVGSIAGSLLALAACAFLVISVLYAIYQIVFWWQFLVVEWIFDKAIYRYKSASVYTERPISTDQFQREGNGINRYQNHLISVSRIKGGWIRRFSLRLTLFVINQICRWWYNRGQLGGIPNIFFLKWVIIDRGRRLLFIDSYHGSWEGYLDAFIDGRAVKGMNAIWSHTYLHFQSEWGKVGYPQTAFLMWKGARYIRPFKEIVRRSQPETLAWYSAYPTLDTENIHANSEIRLSLFEELETHEIDRFRRNLG